MDEEMELNLENLEKIFGGAPREAVEDKALENQDLYRKKQIEELQRQKEALLASKEYNQNNSGRGR